MTFYALYRIAMQEGVVLPFLSPLSAEEAAHNLLLGPPQDFVQSTGRDTQPTRKLAVRYPPWKSYNPNSIADYNMVICFVVKRESCDVWEISMTL